MKITKIMVFFLVLICAISLVSAKMFDGMTGMVVSGQTAAEIEEKRVGSDNAYILGNSGLNQASAKCDPGDKILSGSGTCNPPSWNMAREDLPFMISSSPFTENVNGVVREGWSVSCVGIPDDGLLASSQAIAVAFCIDEDELETCRRVSVGRDTASILGQRGLNLANAYCSVGEKAVSGSGTCNPPSWNMERHELPRIISSSPISQIVQGETKEGWSVSCAGIPDDDLLESSQAIATVLCCPKEDVVDVYEKRAGSDVAGIINEVGINIANAKCDPGDKAISGSGTCNSNSIADDLADTAYVATAAPFHNVPEDREGWSVTCVGVPDEDLLESSQAIATVLCAESATTGETEHPEEPELPDHEEEVPEIVTPYTPGRVVTLNVGESVEYADRTVSLVSVAASAVKVDVDNELEVIGLGDTETVLNIKITVGDLYNIDGEPEEEYVEVELYGDTTRIVTLYVEEEIEFEDQMVVLQRVGADSARIEIGSEVQILALGEMETISGVNVFLVDILNTDGDVEHATLKLLEVTGGDSDGDEGGSDQAPPVEEDPGEPDEPPELPPIEETCNGCMIHSDCVPFGFRYQGKYCALGLQLKTQKQNSAGCDNAFECTSNICTDGACTSPCDGCIDKEDRCLPKGTRTGDYYCGLDTEMKNQLGKEKECKNNYECLSNLCVDDECVEQGAFRKMFAWFGRLFGRKE